MFRTWNMVLIIVAFTLAQMGMFINRGGPVPSVHSFAQSTMGWLFLAFMAGTLILSLAAFVWRMDSLRSREGLDSLLSRESAFLAQNVLFLVVAFVTLWGTIFPVFSEAAQDVTLTVGAPFFNRINGPILLAIVALMGVGPLLPWRRATPRNLVRTLRYPLIAAAVTGVVLFAVGVRQIPGAGGAGDLRAGGDGHCARVGARRAGAARQGRKLRAGVRQAAVGQPAALRRLCGAPGHHHAGGGRDGVVVLQRAARRGHVPRRHLDAGRLFVHLPGRQHGGVSGQDGGDCRVRRVRGRRIPGQDVSVPRRLSRVSHRVHAGRDSQHAG